MACWIFQVFSHPEKNFLIDCTGVNYQNEFKIKLLQKYYQIFSNSLLLLLLPLRKILFLLTTVLNSETKRMLGSPVQHHASIADTQMNHCFCFCESVTALNKQY